MMKNMGENTEKQVVGVHFDIYEEYLNKPTRDLKPNLMIAAAYFGPEISMSIWTFENAGQTEFHSVYYVAGEEKGSSSINHIHQFKTAEEVKEFIWKEIRKFESFRDVIILEDGFKSSLGSQEIFYHTPETLLVYEAALKEKPAAIGKPQITLEFDSVICSEYYCAALYRPADGGKLVTVQLSNKDFETLTERLFNEDYSESGLSYHLHTNQVLPAYDLTDKMIQLLDVLDEMDALGAEEDNGQAARLRADAQGLREKLRKKLPKRNR